MDWQRHYEPKVVDAQEAVSRTMRGSRVFIGTGCGESWDVFGERNHSSGWKGYAAVCGGYGEENSMKLSDLVLRNGSNRLGLGRWMR